MRKALLIAILSLATVSCSASDDAEALSEGGSIATFVSESDSSDTSYNLVSFSKKSSSENQEETTSTASREELAELERRLEESQAAQTTTTRPTTTTTRPTTTKDSTTTTAATTVTQAPTTQRQTTTVYTLPPDFTVFSFTTTSFTISPNGPR